MTRTRGVSAGGTRAARDLDPGRARGAGCGRGGGGRCGARVANINTCHSPPISFRYRYSGVRLIAATSRTITQPVRFTKREIKFTARLAAATCPRPRLQIALYDSCSPTAVNCSTVTSPGPYNFPVTSDHTEQKEC